LKQRVGHSNLMGADKKTTLTEDTFDGCRTYRSAEDRLKQKLQFLELASAGQWGQLCIVRVEMELIVSL